MWVSIARAGVYLVALPFLMWVLYWILDPILGFANSGPHANASSVQRVGGYFGAMTLENLVLLALIAIGVYLLGRAAVERQVR